MTGPFTAICAALLFGVSTPAAKLLLGAIEPVALAGLLYMGSGLGLALAIGLRRVRHGPQPSSLGGRDLPWLAAAILSGGVAGPALLMLGLAATPASTGALLLNLEGVLTALLAWFWFKENFDARIASGMGLIVAGGIALAFTTGGGLTPGSLLIAGACLCWAIDNNLTRKVSGGDALTIACLKGLAAGAVNLIIAALLGAAWPPLPLLLGAGAVGLLGYGVSLVLFVQALRLLGAARTGAYFSLAPFFGAALAIPLQGDALTLQLGLAAALMGAGVWLHLSERHEHEHAHEPLTHTHTHTHDAHHQHSHEPGVDPAEPHVHEHAHGQLVHSHPHYPDLHHRHGHGGRSHA